MLGNDDPMIFSDEAVSGSIALGRRPQGQQLLAGLQPGDTVIAAKLDRMFRDTTDALLQVRTFSEAGINLILLDLGNDSLTATTGSGVEKLQFHFMAAFADFERDRNRERNREGKAALRAQGLHPGGPPRYGFRAVKEGRHSRLVPEEHEQALIKATLLLWDQGLRMKDILSALTAQGFRNRAGNPVASPRVYSIVSSVDPDRENISARTKAALARRKAAGEKLGNPEIRKIAPLGVDAVMQNAAQRLANVLPHIDDLIAAGVSGYRQMARVLNAKGIPGLRGGRWPVSSVRNVMIAAKRSFPAKGTAASHPAQGKGAVRQLRIASPMTQKQRQAIRKKYPELIATLGAPRLGTVQKQAAQILALKAEGLTAADIARVLGVSESAVGEVLQAAGLAGRRRTRNTLRHDSEREKILALRTQGKNGAKIARDLGIPVNRVYTAINQASALDPRFSLGKSHLTPEELDQIATLREQELSTSEIARRLGRSERTVFRAVAKQAGSVTPDAGAANRPKASRRGRR
jgi:DNA invertase Pin-like site-specific DNA recombinase